MRLLSDQEKGTLLRALSSQQFTVQIVSGCSKRPSSEAAGESKPEAYPQGYVEDFDESRTKLADFFSILIRVLQLGR
jgi:hypothetical protein